MPTMKLPCPLCGVLILDDAYWCKHCKRTLPTGPDAKPIFDVSRARATLQGRWYCTQCGLVANPRRYIKGNFGVELLLWLLMLLPGFLYSLWRLSSKYDGCPSCGARNMIPVSSPIAQVALEKTGLAAAR